MYCKVLLTSSTASDTTLKNREQCMDSLNSDNVVVIADILYVALWSLVEEKFINPDLSVLIVPSVVGDIFARKPAHEFLK